MTINSSRRPKIKIYGERHTGTKYLYLLIVLNLHAKLIPGGEDLTKWYFKYAKEGSWLFELTSDLYFKTHFSETLGWKHILLPATETYAQAGITPEDTLFLTLTKNPYSWLLSLYQNPWHAFQKYVSFDEFLKTTWKTRWRENAPKEFATPMEIWNQKNSAYLRLKKSQWNTINLTYESLIADPEKWVNQISQKIKTSKKSEKFLNREATTTKFAPGKTYSDYRDYYLQEQWKTRLNNHQVGIINQHLDEELMAEFGYTKTSR
jgi:hypothetical protein